MTFLHYLAYERISTPNLLKEAKTPWSTFSNGLGGKKITYLGAGSMRITEEGGNILKQKIILKRWWRGICWSILQDFTGTDLGEWRSGRRNWRRSLKNVALPVEETGLKEDVEDFWSTLGKARAILPDITHYVRNYNTTTTRQTQEELRKVMLYDPANKDRLFSALDAAENTIVKSRNNVAS